MLHIAKLRNMGGINKKTLLTKQKLSHYFFFYLTSPSCLRVDQLLEKVIFETKVFFFIDYHSKKKKSQTSSG